VRRLSKIKKGLIVNEQLAKEKEKGTEGLSAGNEIVRPYDVGKNGQNSTCKGRGWGGQVHPKKTRVDQEKKHTGMGGFAREINRVKGGGLSNGLVLWDPPVL